MAKKTEKEKTGIKVYTLRDGYEALKNNDQETVRDIFAKYPQTCLCLIRLIDAPGFERLLEGMPTYVTMRKLEDRFKGKMDDTETGEAAPEDEEDDNFGDAMAALEEEPEAEDEDNPKVDYSTMTAVELYKLCKNRGIEAAPRQKTAVYIKQLEKLDAEEIAENKTIKEAAAEEEWGEDEQEEAPAKPEKKSGKTTKATSGKKSKPTAQKAAAEEEEWEW